MSVANVIRTNKARKIAWTFNDQSVIEKFYLNVCPSSRDKMSSIVIVLSFGIMFLYKYNGF